MIRKYKEEYSHETSPSRSRGAAVAAGDALNDEGIDDEGGASLAELLKRAGATRTEVAAARKIRTENAEVIEYLLDDAGFTAQDVSEMLATKPALARTALVEPAKELLLVGFHSTFNLLGVVAVLPFTGQFTAMMERLVPDRGHPLVRR